MLQRAPQKSSHAGHAPYSPIGIPGKVTQNKPRRFLGKTLHWNQTSSPLAASCSEPRHSGSARLSPLKANQSNQLRCLRARQLQRWHKAADKEQNLCVLCEPSVPQPVRAFAHCLLPGCRGMWEKIACWPNADFGQVVTIPCPNFFLLFSGDAQIRKCAKQVFLCVCGSGWGKRLEVSSKWMRRKRSESESTFKHALPQGRETSQWQMQPFYIGAIVKEVRSVPAVCRK